MDNRHLSEEDFVRRLNQTAVASIPAGPVQIKTVDVDALYRRTGDVVLVLSGHLVVKNDAIERPAFMSTCNLLENPKQEYSKRQIVRRMEGHLSHGCQEALRIEKAGHPEYHGTAFETPGVKLGIAFKQLGEPEAKTGRIPRNLDGSAYRLYIIEAKKYQLTLLQAAGIRASNILSSASRRDCSKQISNKMILIKH